VSLLVSSVFWDEVKVFSADDERTVHLGGDDGSGQDTATDGDETSEWALLVCLNSVSFLLKSCFPCSSCHLLCEAESQNSYTAGRICPANKQTSQPFTTRSQPRREIPKSRPTNVVSFNRSLGCSESQTNVLVPSSSTFANSAGFRL
jgi:hypothetical protein